MNIGVIILRRTKPDLERGFRVPFVPVFPIIGSLLCVYLMKYLSLETWLRFVGWMVLGLIIYFTYGIRHSRLRQGEVVNPEAELPDATVTVSARTGRARMTRESSEEGYMFRSAIVVALLALGLITPSLASAADELSTSNRLQDRR